MGFDHIRDGQTHYQWRVERIRVSLDVLMLFLVGLVGWPLVFVVLVCMVVRPERVQVSIEAVKAAQTEDFKKHELLD